MRFLLLLLLWCFIISLVRAAPDPQCNKKMPVDTEYCVEIIRWRHRTDKEATSTCLEYFPTTFVKGESNNPEKNEIKCTVYRQFQCNHIQGTDAQGNEWKSFSMFDKCYRFTKLDKTMKEYLDEGHKVEADGKFKLCGKDGALPIFFTMTQGKQIAMEAHRQKIEKIWVNLDKNGKTIDEATNEESRMTPKGFMLYKELWKVHNGAYWKGDDLVVMPKDAKFNPVVPAEAEYLFFRSRTDHVQNLIQGSFERATKDTKASVVCEYPAKIVPDQKMYCEKLGEKGLGLNAQYDDSNGRKRCVYTTFSRYSLVGSEDGLKKFEGCKEAPSKEHKSGLDDGTASKRVYDDLTTKGTYRVAAIKADLTTNKWNEATYAKQARGHCKPDAATDTQRQVYRNYDHFMRADYVSSMTSPWNQAYPKDECSDFPTPSMDSNTLAIKEKHIIDVPVPVRFHALCSIELYAECVCGEMHTPVDNDCAWQFGKDKCAVIHKRGEDHYGEIQVTNWLDLWPTAEFSAYSDNIDKAIVRNGCTMQFWSHPTKGDIDNYLLLDTKDRGYGAITVPNKEAGTLNGWQKGMAASALVCTCKADPSTLPWKQMG